MILLKNHKGSLAGVIPEGFEGKARIYLLQIQTILGGMRLMLK